MRTLTLSNTDERLSVTHMRTWTLSNIDKDIDLSVALMGTWTLSNTDEDMRSDWRIYIEGGKHIPVNDKK